MQLTWSKNPKQPNATPEHVMLHPSDGSSSASQSDESRSEHGVTTPVHVGTGTLDVVVDVVEGEVETLVAPPAPVDGGGAPVQAGEHEGLGSGVAAQAPRSASMTRAEAQRCEESDMAKVSFSPASPA
jgi:hypothetical protein